MFSGELKGDCHISLRLGRFSLVPVSNSARLRAQGVRVYEDVPPDEEKKSVRKRGLMMRRRVLN